ncbi:ribbon-helix-helix domain-containing protein [Deltaproteobacteria bacterium OttesenSCG-928-M10]|nr:ribbon-helix-helix domain-containing protein [Deltaproteobacteria bacterium OttesenSCG-928-M10]
MMIQLKPDMESALKSMAEAIKRSPDEIVNDLIARELETWQDTINPVVLKDLDEQHAKIRSTGMAVPWEDARDWIGNWLSDEDQPDPKKCPVL